jgi:hypothetical protein
VPYVVAQARGKTQRQILVECTAGLASIDQVDLVSADILVQERLSPLEQG